jgi:hypothetical protein
MCPKVASLKCVEFWNGHFRTFPNFRFGTRKVWEISSEKSDSENFMRNFAEIGCIFTTYRKPRKKDGFPGIRGFRILTTFRKFSDLYRFYPILPVYLLRSVFLWKHRKCTNFSEFRFGNGEISPKFRRFFFFRRPFSGISGISNRTKFLRNLHSAHCLKWHITLRFSEKPENPGFPGTYSVESSREKFRENVEVCVTGT